MMDAKQLAEIVRNVRNLQKQYFRTRSPMTLEDSKLAEKHLDAVLAVILDPPETDLFSQGEP